MNLSLSFALSSRLFGSGVDPDAQAYIDAVTSAKGSSPSLLQTVAIDTFYKSAKADGYYTSLKRLYLPIWASAAPNAIDMIGLTSGTFNGTVTHGAGYVQGDGSTGYFDIGSSMASHGLTPASGWLGAIMKTAIANHQYLGAQNGSSEVELLRHTTTSITTDYNDGGSGRRSSFVANRSGIISASRLSGDMKHFQRKASGRSNIGTFTYADTGSMTSLNAFALAKNSSGVATSGGTSEMGGWWFGTGVSDAADSAFTLALKNLWETCTGLTLP
jgi:hypothetical protein